MRNHSCCFTGHRQIAAEDVDTLGQRIERAVLKCLELGIYRFYNGGAVGFDTVAAAHVLRLKQFHPEIELHMVLPCREQTAKWSSQQSRTHYNILSRATSVEYVSNAYTPTCMKERNYRMVEASCACICYYDPRHSASGTGQTVREAQRKGLLLLNCKGPIQGNRSYFDV